MRIYPLQPQSAGSVISLPSSGRYVPVPLDALLVKHRMKALAEVHVIV